MCVLWGVPYLLIKVAVREISPAELVFVRSALATVILLPIALIRGEMRAALRVWRPLLVYTLVEISLPWLLLSDAEQYVSSSLSGLVIAGVPLVAAVLVRLFDSDERLPPQRLFGLLVGFSGVVVLLGFDSGVPGLTPVVELAVVVVCYAVGPIIAGRWLADAPNLAVVAGSLALSSLLYAPVVVPGMPELASRITARPALAAVTLAVLCTALAFVLFFALIAEVGPARATVFTFINPAVAVLLGAVVLDERVTPVTAVAFGLILAGSVLATRRNRADVAPAAV